MLALIEGFNIGSLHITFYGIFMALGMALGVFIACKNARFRGLKAEDILVLALYVLPLAIIGARIYYVIFSEYNYSFVEALRFWDGGLAVYGGVIGGAVGVGLYCLIHKKNFFNVGDIVVPALVLGQSIGRVGCLFAGCCYGNIVEAPNLQKYPIATNFIGGIHGSTWFYATNLYESFACALIFTILMLVLWLGKPREKGVVMASYFGLYGIARCIIENFRGDSLYLGSVRVSQLLSGLLIAFAVIYIVVIYILKWKGKRYPKYEGSMEKIVEVKKKKDGNK